MMYNSMIPDFDDQNGSGASDNSIVNKTLGTNQEISLFEIGRRLDQGLGV
ncbi:hypothetical protein ACF3OC_08345 [Sphingobacterium cellulitidis]